MKRITIKFNNDSDCWKYSITQEEYERILKSIESNGGGLLYFEDVNKNLIGIVFSRVDIICFEELR